MMIMTPSLRAVTNKYKRGDVVLAYFPDSNGITSKARPALIVQADDARTEMDQVIVAPITSNMRRAGYLTHITILMNSPEGIGAGLARDSVLMTDSIATIEEDAIDRVIGSLPMPPVEAALRHTFGLL